MSLCASRGPAEQQASWAGIEVCPLRQDEAGVLLTPADHLKPLVLTKDLWFWVLHHDITLSWWWLELSALSYWPPAHTSCPLGPRAPGSPPSSPPVLLPPSSAKWPSPWRAHRNPDHTTVPWAHHSLPEPLSWSAADPPSHLEPSLYPQYFSNSNAPSPPLRASL